MNNSFNVICFLAYNKEDFDKIQRVIDEMQLMKIKERNRVNRTIKQGVKREDREQREIEDRRKTYEPINLDMDMDGIFCSRVGLLVLYG